MVFKLLGLKIKILSCINTQLIQFYHITFWVLLFLNIPMLTVLIVLKFSRKTFQFYVICKMHLNHVHLELFGFALHLLSFGHRYKAILKLATFFFFLSDPFECTVFKNDA